jgi:hypothetical protein
MRVYFFADDIYLVSNHFAGGKERKLEVTRLIFHKKKNKVCRIKKIYSSFIVCVFLFVKRLHFNNHFFSQWWDMLHLEPTPSSLKVTEKRLGMYPKRNGRRLSPLGGFRRQNIYFNTHNQVFELIHLFFLFVWNAKLYTLQYIETTHTIKI